MGRKITITIEEDDDKVQEYPYWPYRPYIKPYGNKTNPCIGCSNYGTGNPCCCTLGGQKFTC